mmetsp:Transcript_1131/g.1488  ORF Transcript_1131/g.1488 Transcript_1131/m.1488 type:complete len:378 (-) Transcript_1131:200-1333(-)|eukprot:CAMPEP_0117734052 /NCGR_PEP_ID=MMETSP0947-20121206/438_1 /TAXON_ID=44440 /ORGANISM="Chattonella subsalsa, Strain CCMP2191" /LENGTH=377 /DNA_ID=CAMNT_0005548745 /DNA_START=115 /DNA_END=1248 /DNA_ORIENTATION=+
MKKSGQSNNSLSSLDLGRSLSQPAFFVAEKQSPHPRVEQEKLLIRRRTGVAGAVGLPRTPSVGFRSPALSRRNTSLSTFSGGLASEDYKIRRSSRKSSSFFAPSPEVQFSLSERLALAKWEDMEKNEISASDPPMRSEIVGLEVKLRQAAVFRENNSSSLDAYRLEISLACEMFDRFISAFGQFKSLLKLIRRALYSAIFSQFPTGSFPKPHQEYLQLKFWMTCEKPVHRNAQKEIVRTYLKDFSESEMMDAVRPSLAIMSHQGRQKFQQVFFDCCSVAEKNELILRAQLSAEECKILDTAMLQEDGVFRRQFCKLCLDCNRRIRVQLIAISARLEQQDLKAFVQEAFRIESEKLQEQFISNAYLLSSKNWKNSTAV